MFVVMVAPLYPAATRLGHPKQTGIDEREREAEKGESGRATRCAARTLDALWFVPDRDRDILLSCAFPYPSLVTRTHPPFCVR